MQVWRERGLPNQAHPKTTRTAPTWARPSLAVLSILLIDPGTGPGHCSSPEHGCFSEGLPKNLKWRGANFKKGLIKKEGNSIKDDIKGEEQWKEEGWEKSKGGGHPDQQEASGARSGLQPTSKLALSSITVSGHQTTSRHHPHALQA